MGTSCSSSIKEDSINNNTIQSCYKYDVFISFEDADADANIFVDYLYDYLTRKGIFAFKSNVQFQNEQSVSPPHLLAIKHSRISIIVFSKNYANSTCCLDEMAAIADCHSKLKQVVFPVFYNIHPLGVRTQNGVYEEAFLSHSQRYDRGRVARWKSAMTCLAESAGWKVNPWQSKIGGVIEKIAEDVIKRLCHKFSGSSEDLIGVQSRVKALESFLKIGSEDDSFKVLGICGVAGIGKTTLAKVLYDRISYQFDACCFIENVNKIYEDSGAVVVEKQILSQTIKENNLDAYSLLEISEIVRNRLHNIKLLVVFDDVDQFQQLQELHISPKLLHGGSRIIITTRDEHILKQYGAKTIYEAQLMNDKDAHKLLCRKAFKRYSSRIGFVELVAEVLKHVQHLPLVISEMGSFLFSRNETQWRAILDKFRNYPPNRRMELPHVCYEELEREIFIQNYKFDVFISFRGPDTRRTFVDHLYAHLTRKGILAFKDDTQLQKGASISPQLLQAIKHSRVSIVVFSKDYAASTWCLDEMATIAHCHAQLKQIVFPVFYDVNPSHVRKQDEVYNNDFLTYKEQFKHDPYRVYQWSRSMTYLAGLAGWDVRNKPEFEEIEKITQAVIQKLGHEFSGLADDLIGLQPRLEELESLLKLSSDDGGSPILGIWGMPGIGKRTLATVLYDRISYQFDACCFIESVSKIYEDGGAIAVQKQILRRTIKENNLDTYSPPEISGIVRNRLHKIKLLVVLDDVDQFKQLEELHISPKLLHAGSKIIITTRDEHILKQYGAETIYEAQLMNDDDAYDLLCRRAFKSDNSSSTFAELIPEVLKYAQGLPIAIRLMGSFLCDRSVTQWRATLDGLQNNPPDKEILNVLQIIFDGLEQREQEIFLHVACFFNGEMEDYVWRVLHACGLNPAIGIPRMVEKSLITIRNKEIHMHGMLKELGKQIVRGEHPDEPELWTRLWHHNDFHHVMITTKKAIEAKAIVVDQKEDGSKFNKLRAENLSKLEHLKLLILNHKNFSGTPVFLSNSLRYLFWNGYPFFDLPSSFQPYNLVELIMPNSSMEQLWSDIQYLPSLKIMDLSNSQNLKETPCFNGMPNLERLDFAGCINLRHVDPSVGLLEKLNFLSLQNCRSLKRFDFGSESKLSSLRVMRLSGCAQLENTPDLTGALNLEYLDMDQCTCLSMIHESIWGLAMLKLLTLRDCTNLVTLPLCTFSTPLPSLIILDLSFCNISEIPEAIGELRCLERLNLQGNNFSSVPSTIERLYSLAYLNLSHCHRLVNYPELPTHSSPPVGRYFETTSGSRDHRSGLYIFNCPEIKMVIDNDMESPSNFLDENDTMFTYFAFKWLKRLLQEPSHFRCGFDIVLPWKWKTVPSLLSDVFNGGSIIRIKPSMNVESIGFVFCVAFEVNSNHPTISGSSFPYPPFYLSFESEYTEEQFDMPLSLERDIVHGKSYLWTIYISPDHCHFVKTGAQITFKALQCLTVNQWGLCMLTEKHLYDFGISPEHYPSLLDIDHVEESNSNNFEPKIPLPYNWLVSDEDEIKNEGAKNKEIHLSNLGLLQLN